jgi:outer membrane immunogenic protein
MRNKLISSLAGAAFSFAASGFAFAADMAVKAPPAPPPPPVYNWTGWYFGVNAGASFGRAKTDFNVTNVTLTGFTACCVLPTGFASSDVLEPSGFIGGGQIGYNWQYSPLIVVGLEADFQGALERDSINLSNPFNVRSLNTGDFAVGTTVRDYSTKIEWFGTVRGRIGYVWGNGNVLSYVTGGLAYGRVDFEGTSTVSGAVDSAFPFSITQVIGPHSHVNTGWVVGYGTEGVIDFWGARNWTWKIEGLYMDLGTLDTTGVTSSVSFVDFSSASGAQVTMHSHFTDGILRAGLNYKFY